MPSICIIIKNLLNGKEIILIGFDALSSAFPIDLPHNFLMTTSVVCVYSISCDETHKIIVNKSVENDEEEICLGQNFSSYNQPATTCLDIINSIELLLIGFAQ